MKISDKTLRAAEKAAKERGKTLDAWAEEVLSAAAAKPSTIEARLHEISEKLDRIADRQSLGEMATDRLSAAMQELDSAFRRGRKGAGQFIEKAEARTSSAAGEVAERVRDLISRASDFAATLSPRREDASQPSENANTTASTGTSPKKDAAEPGAAKTTTGRIRKTTGVRKKAAAGRPSRSKRGTAGRSKPSGRQRRSRRPG